MRWQVIAVSSVALALGTTVPTKAANLFRELDAMTLRAARAAVQSALENRAAGEIEPWAVAGVAEGVVTPRRTWRSTSGHWCREFEERLRLADGRRQTDISIRCRTEDGRWRLTGG